MDFSIDSLVVRDRPVDEAAEQHIDEQQTAEFSAFFDAEFEPAFTEALRRHGTSAAAANSCVHGFASSRRSWWRLSRSSNPAKFLHRKLNGRSGATWLTGIDENADAESLRSLVYVASTEVAGTRKHYGTGAAVGAAATIAILFSGVASTGEPDKLPPDVVSASEKDEVPTTTPDDSGGDDTAPPVTIILDPDALRESIQRVSEE